MLRRKRLKNLKIKGFNAIWLLVLVAITILAVNFAVFFMPPQSPVAETEYGDVIEYPTSSKNGLNLNWFNVKKREGAIANPPNNPNQNSGLLTPSPTPISDKQPYIPPHSPAQPSPTPTLTTGYCGDKVCKGNESCNNCSTDCGVCNTPTPRPTTPAVSAPTPTPIPPAVYSQ